MSYTYWIPLTDDELIEVEKLLHRHLAKDGHNEIDSLVPPKVQAKRRVFGKLKQARAGTLPPRPRVLAVEDDQFVTVEWTAKDGSPAKARFSLPIYGQVWAQ
jgi:hypothetical protein